MLRVEEVSRADVGPDFAATGLHQQRGTIANALVVEVAQVPSDEGFKFPLQAGVYGGFDEAALATAFERARQVRCPHWIRKGLCGHGFGEGQAQGLRVEMAGLLQAGEQAVALLH